MAPGVESSTRWLATASAWSLAAMVSLVNANPLPVAVIVGGGEMCEAWMSSRPTSLRRPCWCDARLESAWKHEHRASKTWTKWRDHTLMGFWGGIVQVPSSRGRRVQKLLVSRSWKLGTRSEDGGRRGNIKKLPMLGSASARSWRWCYILVPATQAMYSRNVRPQIGAAAAIANGARRSRGLLLSCASQS
jgi:hypothetical protein